MQVGDDRHDAESTRQSKGAETDLKAAVTSNKSGTGKTTSRGHRTLATQSSWSADPLRTYHLASY